MQGDSFPETNVACGSNVIVVGSYACVCDCGSKSIRFGPAQANLGCVTEGVQAVLERVLDLHKSIGT